MVLTGRTSESEPNMQNIPMELTPEQQKLSKKIRETFTRTSMTREQIDRKDWEDYQRFESWHEHQAIHS